MGRFCNSWMLSRMVPLEPFGSGVASVRVGDVVSRLRQMTLPSFPCSPSLEPEAYRDLGRCEPVPFPAPSFLNHAPNLLLRPFTRTILPLSSPQGHGEFVHNGL